MRIRSIKPEFWRSSDISELRLEDRLLFIGLWSYVDDNGVGIDKLSAISADLFADDLEANSRATLARVSGGLARLAEANRVLRYTVRNRPYLVIVGWEHQRVDHPGKPRYPLPNGDLARADDYSHETLARVSATLPPVTGEQGNRGTEPLPSGEGALPAPTPPRPRATRLPADWQPDPDLIQAMRLECPTVDTDAEHRKFTDYWKAKSGKDATKADWPATWRNWIRRAAEHQPNGKPHRPGDIDWDAAAQRAAERDASQL